MWHGEAGEAWVRRWLETFLPKRYGVTSGYIVSQGQTEAVKLPHFDVIIYDQLESPVLWVETSPDLTAAGASRAIPAEFVRSVLEVKATFTTASVSDAIGHLQDLEPLLGIDRPEEPLKNSFSNAFLHSFSFLSFGKPRGMRVQRFPNSFPRSLRCGLVRSY